MAILWETITLIVYGRTITGGINRVKHIIEWKGDVLTCPNTIDEDKALCKKNLKGNKMKKVYKRKATMN